MNSVACSAKSVSKGSEDHFTRLCKAMKDGHAVRMQSAMKYMETTISRIFLNERRCQGLISLTRSLKFKKEIKKFCLFGITSNLIFGGD